jgi:predicted dehydrogenase
VAIVTPNHLHAAVATVFLTAGIHVICDKPVTTTSAEAKKLLALAKKTKCIFAVTHNYSGYPMVRHARQMVRDGALGEIRVVQVEYAQEWLTDALEKTGQKQAGWRTDPARSGAGGAIGDIGTHAHHLAGYVTGLELDELCADLSRFVKGRALDDNAQVMLRYRGGARGLLWASQVAPGNQNALRLRVYGSKGGLDWCQEQPNQLRWSPFGHPTQTIERATGAANAAAARVSRIPPGHPEGYLEGFATLYAEIAQAIRAARRGGPKADKAVHFPTLHDGLKGVEFIEAVVKSSARGGRWVRVSR